MFQYALGRAFQNKFPSTKLKYDLSYFIEGAKNIKVTSFKQDLIAFNIKEMQTVTFLDKVFIFFYKILKIGVKELNDVRYKNKVLAKNVGYFDGYWQHENYFKEIREILLKELTLKNGFDIKNSNILTQIQNTESVSIHIRRGDYVSLNYNIQDSLSYYYQAINIISEKIKSPTYFIFSDDIDWVKENLKINGQVIYVNNNEEYQAAKDMLLMSHCKMNIIANSTFSWWSAWLNTNTDKIVIAPKDWIPNLQSNLLLEEWIKL